MPFPVSLTVDHLHVNLRATSSVKQSNQRKGDRPRAMASKIDDSPSSDLYE